LKESSLLEAGWYLRSRGSSNQERRFLFARKIQEL
jgi:hypothetical protein